MVDQGRMESAMNYLAETDEKFAEAKAAVENAEVTRKRWRARSFLLADGTVAERNAKAEDATPVIEADLEYIHCVKVYETLKAKRQRAELTVDVWRTIEASRRKA